jgi:hypothetical protein
MTDLDPGHSREEMSPDRASRRGRPIEMAPPRVLERIRQLASRADGLFRIHRTHSALYARARQQSARGPERSRLRHRLRQHARPRAPTLDRNAEAPSASTTNQT